MEGLLIGQDWWPRGRDGDGVGSAYLALRSEMGEREVLQPLGGGVGHKRTQVLAQNTALQASSSRF